MQKKLSSYLSNLILNIKEKVFDSDSIIDYQDLIWEKDYPLLQFVRI
jgi:hypothetical protein